MFPRPICYLPSRVHGRSRLVFGQPLMLADGIGPCPAAAADAAGATAAAAASAASAAAETGVEAAAAESANPHSAAPAAGDVWARVVETGSELDERRCWHVPG